MLGTCEVYGIIIASWYIKASKKMQVPLAIYMLSLVELHPYTCGGKGLALVCRHINPPVTGVPAGKSLYT